MTDNFSPQFEIKFDNSKIDLTKLGDNIPILPLKNMLFLPGNPTPINVNRKKSLKLVRDMSKKKGPIGIFCQKDSNEESPDLDGFFKTGIVGRIVNIIDENADSATVLLMGIKRASLNAIQTEDPYLQGSITALEDIFPEKKDKEYLTMLHSAKKLIIQILTLKVNPPDFILSTLKKSNDFNYILNLAFSSIEASLEEKEDVLSCDDVKERVHLLLKLLNHDIQLLKIRESIMKKTQVDLDKQQRDYFLQQEMKNIQQVLGVNPQNNEISELKEKAKKKKFSAQAQEVFYKELSKLETMNSMVPEYSTQLSYLETIISLPWETYTTDNFDLKKVKRILDRDHYGLEKIKERILEYLAVLKLKGDMKSPILCLVGPPGVGKTSLGKSIANALKRKYVRISLGGITDEAEIRGHRKTYIGAMPGRIVSSIKKAGSSNPVMVLDEIDKIGQDYKGDPSAALLEALDPEQNNSFHDNYLNIDYDLSKVFFIATANTLNSISQPLLDRMEIIELSGYIMEEKVEIARAYLIPKEKEIHGIDKSAFHISKAAVEKIIDSYTRESGVRNLEKKIAQIMRKTALKIANGEEYSKLLQDKDVETYLGAPIFTRDKYQGNRYAGVVTGLAWTSVGGEILFVETSLSKGKGSKLTLTGNLGDIMKESAVIALEYVKSHGELFGINEEAFEKWNVHMHVPEGAIPKDGPSAGITMVTSLVSAFTQRKVKENLAMTGEITLRGKVLPVGGIKEKILAAKRAGIKEIVLCKENKRDIDEIPEIYLKGLSFHFIENIREVIGIALLREKVDEPVEI